MMTSTADLEARLSLFVEAHVLRGERLDAAALCRDRPDLQEPLAVLIAQYLALTMSLDPLEDGSSRRPTITDPITLRQYGALAGLLTRAGFDPDAVVLAVTMLDNLCLGAALDVGAPSVIWEDNPTLDSPMQTALGRATLGSDRAEKGFELGLSLTIRGLAEFHAG